MTVGRTWALRAPRMFDGERFHDGPSLVVIDGDRVGAVDRSGAHPSGDLEVVDLGDVTLLPGLVDAHVHLAFDPDSPTRHEELAVEDDGTILDRMRRNATLHLRAGVTTVRDLGDRNYLTLTLRGGYAARPDTGPDVIAAGPPITRTRGHCWFLGGEADTAAAVEAAVRERVERGVDVVKIMATGGATTPGFGPHESQYTLGELVAATEAAHAAGKPITAHAHGPQGIADVVAAGMDGVEHVSFFTEDGIEVDWRVVDDMARSGTFVGATEAWLPEGAMLAPHLAERLDQRSANFARMHRGGVRLVCCSDAGAGPRKPHGVLPRGIVHFGSLGLSTVDALASATTVAAAACGVADRKGRIAPGYDADLVAVDGNLLHDLDRVLDVRAVVRRGEHLNTPG